MTLDHNWEVTRRYEQKGEYLRVWRYCNITNEVVEVFVQLNYYFQWLSGYLPAHVAFIGVPKTKLALLTSNLTPAECELFMGM